MQSQRSVRGFFIALATLLAVSLVMAIVTADARAQQRPEQQQPAEKPRAETEAETTGGEMAERGDYANDAWITTKVKIALLTEIGVDALQLDVDTHEGVVTLHGPVESGERVREAALVAQNIEGVREVNNLLQPVPDIAEREINETDERIEETAEEIFEDNEELFGEMDIDSVTDGVVVLEGEADSMTNVLLALQTVAAIPGVRGVGSLVEAPEGITAEEIWNPSPNLRQSVRRLEVEAGDEPERPRPAEAGMREPATAGEIDSPDLWITTKVKTALIAADDVPAFDINVDTRSGVVTLFGTVDSEAASRAAAAAAEGVEGVRAVENELTVAGDAPARQEERRGDEELTQRVEQELGDSAWIENADIRVEVSDGKVTLHGRVADEHERMSALYAARSVEGVRAVDSQLQVGPRESGARMPEAAEEPR
jgi:hyperosmotically inducible protein